MQDQYVIMNTGFKNTVEHGTAVGYQVDIRIPYYRGIFVSSIALLELVVDGQPVGPADLHIAISGKTFTIAQMYEADHVRWQFLDCATLLIRKPGGLNPGLHSIQLSINIRKSYLPAVDPEHLLEDFPGVYTDGKYGGFAEPPTVVTKKMTLVQ